MVNKPYKERLQKLMDTEKLRKVFLEGNRVSVAETTSEGERLWDFVLEHNCEGVVVKDPNAVYELGKRSKQYIKIKNYKYVDVVVEKIEVNPKGTKIFSNVEINGVNIVVECQQAGAFSISPGDTIRVKYLDIVGGRLIQPTRW